MSSKTFNKEYHVQFKGIKISVVRKSFQKTTNNSWQNSGGNSVSENPAIMANNFTHKIHFYS
jgi:hypothetical protein